MIRLRQRDGQVIAYCYHWYSGRFHKVLAGQNILAITIRIGEVVIPLVVRRVAKQGRANTTKPQLLVQMFSLVIDFFKNQGIDITDYPITFDSWYGSQPLREELQALGFSQILVHAKSRDRRESRGAMSLPSTDSVPNSVTTKQALN